MESDLNFRVERSKRRRRFAVRIDPEDAQVVVLAPEGARLSDLRRVFDECREWIRKKRAEVLHRIAERSMFRFEENQTVRALGVECRIYFAGWQRGAVFEWGAHQVRLPESARGDQERCRALLEAAYRKLGKELLPGRTAAIAERFSLRFSAVSVSGARTRWGSCNIHGRIAFSWRLMRSAPPLIDYVISHELAHTLEMNHSERFYAHLARMVPDWRERKEELKQEGLRYGNW